MLDTVSEYFRLRSFRVIDERRWNAKGELITMSEATARVEINQQILLTVAEGNGPVNALDQAIRAALVPTYPQVADIRLVDYKVRILTPDAGTGAVTRVLIESTDSKGDRWVTVGVSANVIDASFNALRDGLTYKLMKDGVK
jgi:2-isopropylmalate synthase